VWRRFTMHRREHHLQDTQKTLQDQSDVSQVVYRIERDNVALVLKIRSLAREEVKNHRIACMVMRQQALSACCQIFDCWRMFAFGQGQVQIQFCAFKCAVVAMAVWREHCQKQHKDWIRIRHFRLRYLNSSILIMIQVWGMAARRSRIVCCKRLRIIAMLLGKTINIWLVHSRGIQWITHVVHIKKRNRSRAFLTNFLAGWKQRWLAVCLGRRLIAQSVVRRCYQHLGLSLNAWKKRAQNMSLERFRLNWHRQLYTTRIVRRVFLTWHHVCVINLQAARLSHCIMGRMPKIIFKKWSTALARKTLLSAHNHPFIPLLLNFYNAKALRVRIVQGWMCFTRKHRLQRCHVTRFISRAQRTLILHVLWIWHIEKCQRRRHQFAVSVKRARKAQLLVHAAAQRWRGTCLLRHTYLKCMLMRKRSILSQVVSDMRVMTRASQHSSKIVCKFRHQSKTGKLKGLLTGWRRLHRLALRVERSVRVHKVLELRRLLISWHSTTIFREERRCRRASEYKYEAHALVYACVHGWARICSATARKLSCIVSFVFLTYSI